MRRGERRVNPNPKSLAMLSLQPNFASLLKAFPPRPVDQQALHRLVEKTLRDSATKSTPENRKAQWEYLLRKDIFHLAVRPICCNQSRRAQLDR